jgi:hypothetical protein
MQEWRLQMSDAQEKRRTSRYTVEAPILCSYFNVTDSVNAKTINFSQDGMYFISEKEFYPGAAVLIRSKNDNPHQNIPKNTDGMRQTTLAEVRWCRRAPEKPTHYQVGVKYYEYWY